MRVVALFFLPMISPITLATNSPRASMQADLAVAVANTTIIIIFFSFFIIVACAAESAFCCWCCCFVVVCG